MHIYAWRHVRKGRAEIMKIMVVTNHSSMLYNFRRELIGELLKENEVVLSMPFVGREDDFEKMGARCINTAVDRRGVSFIKDLSLITAYRKLIKSEKPDLVLTYSIKSNIYAGYMAGRAGVPFFANVQGLGTAFQKPILAKFVTFLYKKAFKKVSRAFFENQANADAFVERGIITKDKIAVLNGAGVNNEYFEYKEYPTHEKTKFLFVGRIMKEKGMDELFAAVKKLKADGYNFVLNLVGFYEDAYQEKVEALEAEGIVKFLDFHEELRPFYEDANCIVMPSYHEGMNNVQLEGAASGRPVIASNIPGCRESVEDGVTGFLCPAKDQEALYDAMKRFMELPIEARAEMGRKGHEKMLREFDKHMIVDATIKLLRGEQ